MIVSSICLINKFEVQEPPHVPGTELLAPVRRSVALLHYCVAFGEPRPFDLSLWSVYPDRDHPENGS